MGASYFQMLHFLALARNRKKSLEDEMSTRGSHFLAALTLVALSLTSGPVSAQIGGGPVDIQLFRPAMDSKGYITLNASQVLGHLDLSFGLVINYAMNPLNMASDETMSGVWCVTGVGACKIGDATHRAARYDINNLITGHFQAAIGLFKHFEVGIGFPVGVWTGDTEPNPSADAEGDIDVQGIGDLGLHLKGRILNTSKHPLGLGVITSIYFPTGDDGAFMGSGRFTIAPTIIVDKEFLRGRVRLALNLGGRFRTGTDSWKDTGRVCADAGTTPPGSKKPCGTITSREMDGLPSGKKEQFLETSHHFTYGVGAAFAIVPQRFALVAEVMGQSNFGGLENMNHAAELLVGAKLYLGRNSYFCFGVGRGLHDGSANHQYGAPDFRVFANFIFEPSIGDRDGDGLKDDVDKCPDDPEDFDDFEDTDGCPDPDNDRDGIFDEDDSCPNEPEDKDGREDDDGCPEADVLDRDGDGIPDEKDSCPDDPEDQDEFEDKNGCPDPDNDKDGILDVDDLCPNKPEDKDGFEDKDGCPDPDNDKDRILDVDDTCPNEPETYNGHEDEDGCPDKGKVIVHQGRIEILEKIYFETDKAIIKPVSFPLLDAIIKTLKGNPQILQIEIQGHADERDSHAHNLKLTDDRAHSVKSYIVNKGIDPHRLMAKGYGETRPVDKRHNEEAWSKNRRVEFVILKRAD